MQSYDFERKWSIASKERDRKDIRKNGDGSEKVKETEKKNTHTRTQKMGGERKKKEKKKKKKRL